MNSKFDTLYESNFNRFQGGGFLTGDVINFKSDWNAHEWCKSAPQQTVDKIKELADSDLILRVSSVKAVRPSVNSDIDQAHGVDNFFVDLAQEIAPGRYNGHFITVPQDIIEFDTTGNNERLPDIPDSLKREEDVDLKPKELENEDTSNEEDTRNVDPVKDTGTDDKVNKKLKNKNETQPGATGAVSYTAGYIQ